MIPAKYKLVMKEIIGLLAVLLLVMQTYFIVTLRQNIVTLEKEVQAQ